MSELLDRSAILGYLTELAEELPQGPAVELIVVGGAMVAWLGLREATRDVDSAAPLSQEIQGAAARVAERHDLSPTWLNADAAPFAGAVGPDINRNDPMLVHGRLSVYAATVESVFLMKLYADRPEDEADLVALWPLCGFASPNEAADRCNELYAFIGVPDPHLVRRVETIAAAAGR